jgi:hypothetical protein
LHFHYVFRAFGKETEEIIGCHFEGTGQGYDEKSVKKMGHGLCRELPLSSISSPRYLCVPASLRGLSEEMTHREDAEHAEIAQSGHGRN